METGSVVFSFDFGKASLGEAVRLGHDIHHHDSLLVPEEFADIKEQAVRRRAARTRVVASSHPPRRGSGSVSLVIPAASPCRPP